MVIWHTIKATKIPMLLNMRHCANRPVTASRYLAEAESHRALPDRDRFVDRNGEAGATLNLSCHKALVHCQGKELGLSVSR